VTEGARGTGPVEFDPFSSVYFDDPYETYRRLRDERPVYRNDRYGFTALSRWDDVVEASRNWQTFSSAHGVDLATLTSGRRPEFDSLIMIDPPKHNRLRALVSRVFSPRAVSALEPMIREVVRGFLDELGGRSGFDAVAEFSGPFPVEVISVMLGVPPAERQQIRHWLDLVLTREEGQIAPGRAAQAAGLEMGSYFYELVGRKRRDPDEGMISRLIEATVADEEGREVALDDMEIAGFVALLGGAGAETVTKLVANAIVLFDSHPDQWDAVLGDRSLIPGAVEELLRYHPPSQYQGRWTTEEVTLHGETIPAGRPVILITGAATRDERHFEDPDRFEILRKPELALGLGHGVHACLGAALARMESRIAIEEFGARFPVFEVDREGLRRVQMANVAGYSSVPVAVGRGRESRDRPTGG
jgi:cytochrome P450